MVTRKLYPNLPAYIVDMATRAILTQRVGDYFILELPDGRWASASVEQVFLLH